MVAGLPSFFCGLPNPKVSSLDAALLFERLLQLQGGKGERHYDQPAFFAFSVHSRYESIALTTRSSEPDAEIKGRTRGKRTRGGAEGVGSASAITTPRVQATYGLDVRVHDWNSL